MLMTVNSGMEVIARGRRSKAAEMCNCWHEVEDCYIMVCPDAPPSRVFGGGHAMPRTSTPAFTTCFSRLLRRFHLRGLLMGHQFSFPKKVSMGGIIFLCSDNRSTIIS